MKNQPDANDPAARPDEDTEAILSRRRFLIQSTLAGAGIGAVASVCEARICLSIIRDPDKLQEPDPQTYLVEPSEPEPRLGVAQPPEPSPESQQCSKRKAIRRRIRHRCSVHGRGRRFGARRTRFSRQ